MQPRKQQPPPSHQVYLTGFPHPMTSQELRRFFIGMGFREVNVTVNTRGLKPFAFVTFRSEEDATRALAANGHVLFEHGESLILTVSPVREKTQFGTGRGGGEAASLDPIPAAAGGGAVGAGRQSLHFLKDPNNFFGMILSRIKAFPYVLPQTAVGFTRDYTREHGNKEPGEFTSKDVDAAIEEFKEQVDPYHILGFREGSVPLEFLPAPVRAKIRVALNMSTSGPSGLSGAHVVPNAYVFIAGKKRGIPDERTLCNWSQSGVYVAPLMFFTWNAGLNHFTTNNGYPYHDDLVLVIPKCIGPSMKKTGDGKLIIRDGGYNHFLQDAIVASGGEYSTFSVYEVSEKHYGPNELRQIQAKMTEPLSSWCDPMEAMGATRLCVHFQQEASASADPWGEEDSTSSNPWGEAASSVSSNPWGAAAP